ncbi:MAG TPA: alkaline phosphatase family protein [Thermodesulfovibrionales bacterium]|nr:alkaline phosphatase family protein [Thermodesulfovibrionales bacterium]
MIPSIRLSLIALVTALSSGLVPIVTAHADDGQSLLQEVNHIVVIYQENHSFDNLFGGWEHVDGIRVGDTHKGGHVPQVDQEGRIFACLPQNDVNLTSAKPFPKDCSEGADAIGDQFKNKPFSLDKLLSFSDLTCVPPGLRADNGLAKGYGLRGGCTRDMVHRFYQEQYQINKGRMDRYVVGSDAVGLVMGYYETNNLPIYKYLHRAGHPRYVIADNFFQAAFGGSFLNHQWLIAARTPEWVDAVNDGSAFDQHSVVDSNGMPKSSMLYTPPANALVMDQALTASCKPSEKRGPTPAGVVCGNFVVNTIQSRAWPYDPNVSDSEKRLPLLTTTTIGDELTAAGVDWAWYSGGWANAEGADKQPGYTNRPRYTRPGGGPQCPATAYENARWPKCPDKLFQFHHQPFNYYANYAPGTKAREDHLRDEEEFILLAKGSRSEPCKLRKVSFVKPNGGDNEHPGYASLWKGNNHLVDLIKYVVNSSCAKDTMIIVTYDEFGGQADHVPPPATGNPVGPYDQWGPGTRIPALVIAPHLKNEFAVDHEAHDTTSILATIEHRFGLSSLGSRDAAVKDLSTIFKAKGVPAQAPKQY